MTKLIPKKRRDRKVERGVLGECTREREELVGKAKDLEEGQCGQITGRRRVPRPGVGTKVGGCSKPCCSGFTLRVTGSQQRASSSAVT